MASQQPPGSLTFANQNSRAVRSAEPPSMRGLFDFPQAWLPRPRGLHSPLTPTPLHPPPDTTSNTPAPSGTWTLHFTTFRGVDSSASDKIRAPC